MTADLMFINQTTKQLIKTANEGQFAVPKLQRAFVWNGPKAARLLDSINRGMPVGALTIWVTSKKNHLYLRENTTVLPRFEDRHSEVRFLLDGQQRLSVLYRLMKGGFVENATHRQVDFERIVFRVTEGEGEERLQYRKPITGIWIPVKDILARDWRKRLEYLSNGQLNRAGSFRSRFLEYKVPMVCLRTEKIDDARELFIRINSAGTPIGSADRAFARAAKFDLRELAGLAWQSLPQDFQGMTPEVILQTRALLDGIREVGVIAMERVGDRWDKEVSTDITRLKGFKKIWEGQQKATGRAIDLLRSHFMVLDEGLLPSQNMVATLTVFFKGHPKQPTPKQLAEIRKWFWATALGARYSGRGHRQNIIQDADFFEALGSGRPVRFKLDDLIDPSVLRNASYIGRSSVSDAIFCLLVGQSPIYMVNGSRMQVTDYASPANRKHKHHIFPRKFLQQRGVSKSRLNSALNLCLIPAEENSQYGSKPPLQYLGPHRELKHFDEAMRRHLIPAGPDSDLWARDSKGYNNFLKQRERVFIAAFEKVAGCRLFRRD